MQFDPRLTKLGIVAKETANATWDLTVVQYQDDQQSGGQHHIFFTVLDSAGKPMPGVTCVVDYPQDPSDPHKPAKMQTDANGQANYPMFANLDITLLNGPYFAYVEDQGKSDLVTGMGLPEKHHVNYLLTFAKSSGGGTQPQPTDASTAAITAAKKLTWMPINTDGALYKFAETKNLGYPQTDEFEFTHNNVTYVGQVYNLGIVFVKKGDWGNCQWVKKP
ncbi:MAG: hypothetical protein HZB51_04825 [Chloroflexi bacterium]|nr:hypothetical protein [Chloroflexota bacterium]